ncbi:WD repeat-containing protein 55 isoform X1 [Oratosquilla oratoria]|uniref:WD repeat-containing protein 55 isoform X1 n=1 Tax=Oratosquilla oratoria TaxID=337810 RepID=UPI003F76EB99
MNMKSFIPNIDDPPESDDSGDEIPPGGIFPAGGGPGNVTESEDDNEEEEEEEADNEEAAEQYDEATMSDSGAAYSSSYYSSSESEAEATMEEVFGIKPALEAQRNKPPDLETDSGVVDICFHPIVDLIATATMDGEVIVYRYSNEEVKEEARFGHHRKACRAVCFNEDGTQLFTVSKDKSVMVVDTQNCAPKYHIKDAHDAAIYSFYPVSEYLCATGDDDGTVKIWDYRRSTAVFSYKCGEQTVMSMTSDENNTSLVAAVSDGSIAAFNIKARKLEMQSEMYKSELTSLCLVRGDTRLVVGSGEGTLYIFNWGEFSFHLERLQGHPDMVHCMVPITDRLILTGCEDGNIRAVHFYANRFVGIVGQHKDFGIENLSVSNDSNLLASCSLDDVVRFWNIEYLYDTVVNEKKKANKNRDVVNNLPSSRRRNQADFFNDFPEKLEDSDDERGPVDCQPGPSSS